VNIKDIENNFVVVMPCREQRDRTPECVDYCRRTILTPEQEAVLIRIYEMRSMQVNTNLGQGPRNGLPLCKFHGVPVNIDTNSWANKDYISDECWNKIVTDRGECFVMLHNNGDNFSILRRQNVIFFKSMFQIS
jgi:hypothetical protein